MLTVRLNARGVLLVLFCSHTIGFVRADAPRVVRTVPKSGATDVDPNLKQIIVEFDQDMARGSHSWCGGGDAFPETRGLPSWRTARIAVLPVKLKPNHEYHIGINCQSFRNFRSAAGESLKPYGLSFETGGDEARATITPEENRTAIEQLREAVEQRYSYRDLRKIDWDARFKKFAPKLEKTKTPEKFAREAGRMLAVAKDLHVWLTVGERTFASYRRSVRPNCNTAVLKKLVPQWTKRNDAVTTGRFPGGIGYILLPSWADQHADNLEEAVKALDDFADTRGLIVDVRLNSGGSETLAARFAGCFLERPEVYARHVTRESGAPGGFTRPSNRVVEPLEGRKPYAGKVVVLTGKTVMSSCEAFLLMMKQVPGCKLVGENSYGSSGNPKAAALSNGVTVYLPSWKSMTPGGELFEGVGIAPDVEVKMTATDFMSRDPVLAAALKLLRR